MKKIFKYYPPGYTPQEYWEKKYAKEHVHQDPKKFESQHFWQLLKNYLHPGKRYLDVGCGIGGWIIFLRDQGYDVSGIDTAEKTIAFLRSTFPSIPIQEGSITAIPYPEESFDGILAIGTLEYAEDAVHDALQEVARVLKHDGIFFLEVPAINLLRRLLYLPLKHLQGAFMHSHHEHPTFSHYLFSTHTLSQQLERAGFTVLAMQPHELPGRTQHYGLYVDWFILRGDEPYTLNTFGLWVKAICEWFSPWIASTGIVVVAKKK